MSETVKLLPCPFCGSTNIDPDGWASTERSGPACDDCSGSADTVEMWNSRPISQAGAVGGVVDGWKIVPIEPDELQIEAMRDAFRQARRGGVCGMTIDAQWRRENAPELAAYSAALTAAPTPPATPVQPTASVEAVAVKRKLLLEWAEDFDEASKKFERLEKCILRTRAQECRDLASLQGGDNA